MGIDISNGIDFDDYPQFTAEEIEWQKQAYKESLSWEYIDEGKIIDEMNGVGNRINAFVSQMVVMQLNNEFKKTDDMRKALLLSDIGSGGWVSEFYMKNSQLNSPDIPSDHFFETLEGVLGEGTGTKQSYLQAKKYYHDAGELLRVFLDLRPVLNGFPLEEGYRIDLLRSNFEDGGFDRGFYDDIDSIIYNVREWMSGTVGGGNDHYAVKAEKYYTENLGKQSKSSLNDGYRKKRREDYVDAVRKQWFCQECFNVSSDGTFSVKPNMEAKAKVIDDYTLEISQMKSSPGFRDVCEWAIDKCKKLQSETLTKARQDTSALQTTQNLLGTVEDLVRSILRFCELRLETYGMFQEANDNAPYCYMKLPPHLNGVAQIGGYAVSEGDPREKGTRLKMLFTNLAKALTSDCEQFVIYHGHQELRG